MSKKNRKENRSKAKSVRVEEPEIIKIEKENRNGPLSFLYGKNQKISYIVMSLILGLTSFFIYYDTIDHDLVYCDDNIFVHDYEKFNKKYDYKGTFDRTFGTSYYRPILGMSFVWDSWFGSKYFDSEEQKGNTNPSAYQTTNNLLHVIGTILVFSFLLYMKYDLLACFFLSLIFAVHPILTPAVSWISGRNDSLLAITILISFLTVLKYYRTKDMAMKVGIFLFHLLCFAAALFTKEISVMFPILIVFFNLLFREKIFNRTKSGFKFNTREFFSNENLALAGGWSLVAAIWWKLRTDAFVGITNPDTIGFEAVAKNLPMPLALVGKMLAPVKMLALPTFEIFSIMSGAVFIVALILLSINIKDVRKRNITFGLAWFLLFLVPALFVRILDVDDFFDYAEHRAYLVMVGIFVVLLELMRGAKVNYQKPLTLAVFGLIIFSFAYKSNQYQKTFDGRVNFWTHKTIMEPQVARGYLDLGKAYLVQGKYKEADSLYDLGIERNPKNANFYIDKSVIKLGQKKYKQAEKLTRTALTYKPNEKMAMLNLGNALFFQQKYKDAIPYLSQAAARFKAKPRTQIDALHKIAICHQNIGEIDKAINFYSAALRLNDKNYQVLSNYGVAVSANAMNKKNKKLQQDAENILIQALNLNVKHEPTYFNLINHYLRFNEAQKIIPVLKKAQENKIKIRKAMIKKLKQIGLLK